MHAHARTHTHSHTQDRLDPIDWATYEPHLWANCAHYFQRTATLLGTLSQLTRAAHDGPGPAGRASSAGGGGAALGAWQVRAAAGARLPPHRLLCGCEGPSPSSRHCWRPPPVL